MLLLLPLLLLPFCSAVDVCETAPPALWCQNKELAAKCGFTEHCDRYSKSRWNQPVQITLLYEALCPGCQRFITEQLYPKILKNFADFVQIELVPYGNAKRKDGVITCQHGEEECKLNRFESCIIDAAQDQATVVPIIYCLENQLKAGIPMEKASEKCFRTLQVDEGIVRMTQSCLVSKLGEKLQFKAAERTENVYPEAHTHVPWVLFNNVSLNAMQNSLDNIPDLICQFYQGDKKIAACEGSERRRLATIDPSFYF